MKNLPVKSPAITAIIMLILAILPLPIGYYVLLRLVVCCSALFLAYNSYQRQHMSWVWGMGFVALIFNPLIPIYLGRALWGIVDVVGAIVFAVYLIRFKES